MTRAVADAETYERRVAESRPTGARRSARSGADSAVDLLAQRLARGAGASPSRARAALIGRSDQAVNEAIPRLVDAGVLKQTTVGRRNRAFEAPDLIRAFTDLERQLASPDGDTLHSPPERRIPQRRR